MSTDVDPFTMPNYDEITTADTHGLVRCKPEVFPIDDDFRMRVVLIGKTFSAATDPGGSRTFHPHIMIEHLADYDAVGAERWVAADVGHGRNGVVIRELVMAIRRLSAQQPKAATPIELPAELARFAGPSTLSEIIFVGPIHIGTAVPEQPFPPTTVFCESVSHEMANRATGGALNNGKRGEVDHD
jgi:hypothetical protein